MTETEDPQQNEIEPTEDAADQATEPTEAPERD